MLPGVWKTGIPCSVAVFLRSTSPHEETAMKRTQIVVALLSLAVAAPALAKTYKYSYPNACSEMWPSVKATLADAEHYAQVMPDDEKMTAEYQPKHDVHVDVTGVLLQRINHVTLLPSGNGATCEMQIVSNYSGWGHDDKADFKKRVDESMVKLKAAPAGGTG